MTTTVNEDVNLMFTNIPIKFKLLAMSQIEWESYLLGEEYQLDVVRECITQIGAKIFGKDHAGINAYIHLWHQIRELKVSLYLGIRKYGSWGKSAISFAEIYNLNNILFFLKMNIILHFPGGFVHIFSAVRT